MNIQCSRCSSDSVNVLKDIETVAYKGKELNYEVVYSLCNECGHEFMTSAQVRTNDANVRNSKREADDLFLPNEIITARSVLGITQEQAAIIFGGGKNAFSKYERGEVVQSQSMDSLMKISLKFPEAFDYLVKMRGVSVSRSVRKEFTATTFDVCTVGANALAATNVRTNERNLRLRLVVDNTCEAVING